MKDSQVSLMPRKHPMYVLSQSTWIILKNFKSLRKDCLENYCKNLLLSWLHGITCTVLGVNWLLNNNRLELWTTCLQKPSKTLHPSQEKPAQRFSYRFSLTIKVIIPLQQWNICFLFFFKDKPQRRCVVPWMHPVLHDVWKNTIPKHHKSDCQAAGHHWSLPQDWIARYIRKGSAGCPEGETRDSM